MSKSDIEHSSSGANPEAAATDPAKPTLFQRFKTHMKRWWWVYLIAFCVVVLVVVLPVIYVGVPNFANKYINDYEYDYSGLEITNPRPDAFHVRQKKKISMGGGFSGSGYLSPFDADIKVPDTEETFAVFPVQRIAFDGGAELDIDQDLHLDCVECLGKLAVQAATNEDLAVLVTGKPDLKFGALPTAHLDIHKTMKMKGYDVQKFVNTPGSFNVTSVNLLKPPTKEGYNVNATVVLKNPTPFSVEMGSVSFNLSMGGSDLGYIDIPNLTLKQPSSELVMLGDLDMDLLIQQGVFGDGDGLGEVTIDVQGTRCEYKGEEIPYFAPAIKAIKASAHINLMDYASSLM